MKHLFILLLVYSMMLQVFGSRMTGCPNDHIESGHFTDNYHRLFRCNSNKDCPSNKTCVAPFAGNLGFWVCVHKVCRYSWQCEGNKYCHKPLDRSMNWLRKGICCEKYGSI